LECVGKTVLINNLVEAKKTYWQIFSTRLFMVIMVFTCLSTNFVYSIEKPTVVVMDFQLTNVSENDRRIYISLLSSAFLETDRFQILDLSERDKIIKQMNIVPIDGFNEKSLHITEMGTLFSSEFIVLGLLVFSADIYTIKLKFIKASSEKLLKSVEKTYSSLKSLFDDTFNLGRDLAGIPIDDHTKESVKTRRKFTHLERSYSSLSVSQAPILTLGKLTNTFCIAGSYTTIDYHYNFNKKWGILGFGLKSFFILNGTKNITHYVFPYRLLSWPQTLSIRYATNCIYPFYCSVQFNPGLAINYISYNSSFPNVTYFLPEKKLSFVNLFASFGVDLGYYFIPNFSISLNGTAQGVFFHNTPYWGMSAGFRFEFNF
jgi:hypothetical protein